MDDKHPKKKSGPKKPYAKPEAKRVRLKPEEAVLGGCKTSSVVGPGPSTCTTVPACPTNAS